MFLASSACLQPADWAFFIMYNPHDTICAISTPPGESALAIVRLSGKEAKSIAERHLKGIILENRRATFAEFQDNNQEAIDETVVIWYQGPRSYTAEDLVEIICHGGYVVSEQVLTSLCESGTRLAEPGEFTLRAFLNGRLDLTEAEAVDSVIKAKSAKAKEYAIQNLEGKLRRKLEIIDKALVDLITLLEAEIDFSDEEIDKTGAEDINIKIGCISTLLIELLATYDVGRIAEGRAQIAIVGAPNVGKSSLFNVLLQSNRAIVTESPGTTRDYLSEYVNIGGYPVILTDTAGIRDSGDNVERIGIGRSKELINQSDLCLFVVDLSRPPNADDRSIAGLLTDTPYIMLKNKADIELDSKAQYDKIFAPCKSLRISAQTGDGLDGLVSEIRQQLLGGINEGSEGIILSQRQFNCARNTAEFADQASIALKSGESEEIIVGILREALEQIGQITGRVTNDDILNNIFSRFCIGK